MVGPIREIVDLAHELYTGMPNIGDQQIAFWPIESFEGLRTITEGRLAMESRMMRWPSIAARISTRPATSTRPACR
jgi:hypothetical protein